MATQIWMFTVFSECRHSFLIGRFCFIHLKKLCKALHNAFKALGKSGFNIEDTHLTYIDRVCKLLSMVLIAFT
jgi:hypothetical protein